MIEIVYPSILLQHRFKKKWHSECVCTEIQYMITLGLSRKMSGATQKGHILKQGGKNETGGHTVLYCFITFQNSPCYMKLKF